ARSRVWAGEPVDVGRRDGGAYELFTLAAGTAAALADGEIFRRVVRRNTMLEPLTVLDGDVALQQRIEKVFAEDIANRRARPGPPRDELVAKVTAALENARSRPLSSSEPQ